MSIFYGWKIGALSMGGNFMLQGASIYCMNAFMEPLCDLHGWTRMGLNFSLGLAALFGQFAMPLAAFISAKMSLRLLMGLGGVVGGLATCAMGYTDNINMFTLYLIILWVASQFCGGVVANALMSNWFSHYRGMALGVANSGTSLSGIILPMCVLVIINNFNLPIAYACLGAGCAALGVLCWFFVRNTPAALHMHPDGRRHEPRQSLKAHIDTSLKTLIRRPAVWNIGIAFGLGLMCATGVISQIKPRFSDYGLSAYTAMLLASLSALAATLAKYIWGWICDKFSPIWAARGLMAFCLTSLALVLLPQNLLSMATFAICFTLGTGGLWVVLPAIVANYFGPANFLGVYKIISIFIIIRCFGFPVMGMSHEYGGDYLLADLVFMAGLLLAFVLTLFLHPEKAIENSPHPTHHKK